MQAAKAALDRLGDGFKAEVVQRLANRIEVLPDTFVLHYNVGEPQKKFGNGSNTVDDGGASKQ